MIFGITGLGPWAAHLGPGLVPPIISTTTTTSSAPALGLTTLTFILTVYLSGNKLFVSVQIEYLFFFEGHINYSHAAFTTSL